MMLADVHVTARTFRTAGGETRTVYEAGGETYHSRRALKAALGASSAARGGASTTAL